MSSGTIARTWSTWSPQPDQVILPHVRQRTGLHIGNHFFLGGGGRSKTRSSHSLPGAAGASVER
jgi:hypothetical protein